MEKSWKFQGGGVSNAKPSGTENPVGWGIKLETNPPWRGGGEGMDIFWNHTIRICSSILFYSCNKIIISTFSAILYFNAQQFPIVLGSKVVSVHMSIFICNMHSINIILLFLSFSYCYYYYHHHHHHYHYLD